METIVIKKVETICLCTILTEDSAALKEGGQEEFMAFSIICQKLISETKKMLVASFGKEKKWASIDLCTSKLIRLSNEFEKKSEVDVYSSRIYYDEDICVSLVFDDKSISLVATTFKTSSC